MSGIELLHEGGAWDMDALGAVAARAVPAAIAAVAPGLAPEIAILACDDDRIAALNRDFRGKAHATNVLSWPAADLAPATPGGRPAPPREAALGDIAIAHDTCAREAAEQGKAMDDHVTHLLVHATLHLMGFDHETDADADRMEALEVRILRDLGLSDPYV